MKYVKQFLLGLLTLCVCFFLGGCGDKAPAQKKASATAQKKIETPLQDGLQVTLLNVGKADAILLQIEGKNVLVDGGLVEDGQDIANRLQKNYGVKKIDTIIMTHPHKDHIGGLLAITNSFNIGTVYDTGVINKGAKIQQALAKAYKEKNIPVKHLEAPMEIKVGKKAKLEVLWPVKKKITNMNGGEPDYNANSAVIRLCYGKFTMMLMGDATKASEQAMLRLYSKDKFKAQVLKVGHHTSNTSTGDDWLDVVKPEVAVASYGNDAGKERKYPNPKTLKRIKDRKIKFYGTYDQGDISILSDGDKYVVKTKKK